MPVYFAQAGEAGPVKIGWAADTQTRVKALQCGCPEKLRVLRAVDGDRCSEAWVHREFAPLRIRGEWFRFDPQMLVVIPAPEPRRPRTLSASSHLQPAARVIAICGGIEAVARLVGRDRSSVNRWLLPKESGGTGGLIPMRSAAVLLAKVSELKEQDFFAIGETSDDEAA